MESVLSNAEFNALLKEVKVEKHGFTADFHAGALVGVDPVLEKLKVYWKVIKPILRIAKLISPPKIDKGIDEFIAIVDRLLSNPPEAEKSELLERFAIVWGIVRPILVAVKDITPAKADAIIDEVIKIGDLLAKS